MSSHFWRSNLAPALRAVKLYWPAFIGLQLAAGAIVIGYYTSPAVRGTAHWLLDWKNAVGLPFVEVHLSNVYAREPFRHTSLLRDVALGVVLGFGADSYGMGLRGLISHLRRRAGDAGPAPG